jgi:geranylgeranyl pyrophosphate synthase
MEWWYLAGVLNSHHPDEEFAFVSTFFSYSEDHQKESGHMLIFALTRLPSERIATVSLIDEELRASAFANLSRVVKRGKAHDYAKAYYESLKRCKVPRPHEVAVSSHFESSHLFSEIGSNHLIARGAGKYNLHLEDKDCVLELDLDVSKPAMLNGDNGLFNLGSLKMNYYSYPRVRVLGLLGLMGRSIQVSGSGWLDHQWGDSFKFLDTLFKNSTNRSNRISWQWFGIQLNSNHEINAYIASHSATRRPLKPSVTASLPTGQTMALGPIEMRPHDSWQSLRTLNIYPVGWTVNVPDLALWLEMKPVMQVELPVFGPTLGVLEVLHRVQGQLDGRDIEGTCWAETLGDTFNQGMFWKGEKQCVNYELEKIIPRTVSSEWLARVAGPPIWERDLNVFLETITKPLWDLFTRGGKRWRPLWLSLCCDAVGGDSEKYRNLLAIPELFHTGSLIVDDIEDSSNLRRGASALHVKYGIPIALNVGNMLYYLPLVLLEENKALSTQQKYQLYKLVASVGRRAHLGQAADIYLESDHVDLEALLEDYPHARKVVLQTYADKTGTQAMALAKIGGIIGGGSEEQIEMLGNYSDIVGMTFQIVNDISNLEHHQKGKRGEDISQGKLRFLTLEAIFMAQPSERRRLLQILRQRTKDQQRIDEAITIIRKSGAISAVRQQMDRLIDEKWEVLSPLLDESEAKVMLRAGPKWLLRQENFEAQL